MLKPHDPTHFERVLQGRIANPCTSEELAPAGAGNFASPEFAGCPGGAWRTAHSPSP